ncbi:uncharacterized protein BYT42DRAFT_619437 [Radiomyces spectabilis]|uniref:uncharacterized protein n=1 Tax=Radiomyces spectabilis TaxID=64574 RepID=UPI00221FF47B|nr:uncharacterized protein BYT42DRAFT_549855 [Radiomyces spectabilis]XP_051428021.1 uncharacterized protein BYT42DRAFT_619437 [Radiomyces spectabilis]KAI8366793.1 hypothetical protein BYT42DRAFT_549855 [Radiomyces spectabilis]KAI8393488.1 hypothetical protein BYT42DRAFT_619437 [Radiomyces spectabilis]
MSTTSPDQFAAMQAQINYLTAQVTTHRTELDQIRHLLEENQQLRNENAQLKAQLAAATASVSTSYSKPTVSTSAPNTETATRPTSTPSAPMGSDASQWATVTKKYRPVRPKPKPKTRASDARTFQITDGPSGFQYLYIPRSRRLTRHETRTRLRRLGVDPYRVLDITFPARSVVGLLIHVQYRALVEETLGQHNILVIHDFDPCDPIHMADPEVKQMSLADQQAFAESLHSARCEKAVLRLPYHLASPIARSFLEANIFDTDDVSRLLSRCRGAPVPPTNTDTTEKDDTDPDTDMADAKHERAPASNGKL